MAEINLFDEYELLPDDELEPTPEEELDAALRSGDDADEVEVLADTPYPFGKTWAYNFHYHPPGGCRFMLFGHDAAPLRGVESLKGWIWKTLETARGAHPIYSDDYGVDVPYLMIGEFEDAEQFADYERQAREALLYHDRISAVEEFEFSRDPDEEEVRVTFTVVLDDGEEVPIELPPPETGIPTYLRGTKGFEQELMFLGGYLW